MPNWCCNEIRAKCSEEEAKQIMEEIKGPNGDVDYNSIIPMPITIPNYIVHESFLLECLAAFCTIQNVPWPEMSMIKYPFIKKIYSRYINKKYVITRQQHDIMYLIGKLVYYNLTTNGYLSQYDWNCINCDVKWNASNPEVDYDGELIISFESPWWMPERVLEQLSKKHPNIKFEVDLSGELSRDYYFTLQNGVWKEDGKPFLID